MNQNALISIKPHLQLLSEHAVALVWKTARPAAGQAEWSQNQGNTWVKGRFSVDGFLDAGGLIHRSVLKGFRSDLPLIYRVRSRAIREFGPYHAEFDPQEECVEGTMNALHKEDGSFSFLMMNDFHNDAAIPRRLLSFVQSPVSFVVLNGDLVSSLDDEETIDSGILAPMNFVTEQACTPIRFLRGNHETRGATARKLHEALLPPDGHYYGAMTFAGVRFVFLDTGEDKEDSHQEYSGLVDFDGYLEGQCEWLEDEFASEAWRTAQARIVFLHIPPRVTLLNGDVFETRLPRHVRLFKLLASAKITIAFAGHLHVAGNDDANALRPYPLIVGGGGRRELLKRENRFSLPTITHCSVTQNTITVKQIDFDGRVQFTKVVPIDFGD